MTNEQQPGADPDDQSFIWTWGDLDPNTGEYTDDDQQ